MRYTAVLAALAACVLADSYSDACVNAHNNARAINQAPPVTWDDNLAGSAQALANTCNFAHDTSLGPASGYGQNLAAAGPATGSPDDAAASAITDLWYNGEINNFNQYGVDSPDLSNFDSWGHFTQVVWVGSTAIGCATTNCPDLGWYTVCDYGPAGNVIGDFAANVLPPQ